MRCSFVIVSTRVLVSIIPYPTDYSTLTGFGGRLYPATLYGKWVVMIYAFIGVPALFSMTGDVGLVLFEGLYYFWYNTSRTSKKEARAREDEEEMEFDPDDPNKPPKAKFKTLELLELQDKIDSTYPVSMGTLYITVGYGTPYSRHHHVRPFPGGLLGYRAILRTRLVVHGCKLLFCTVLPHDWSERFGLL